VFGAGIHDSVCAKEIVYRFWDVFLKIFQIKEEDNCSYLKAERDEGRITWNGPI
jgi:hypothetical protein